jgi:hypothetical protein
MQYLHHFGLAGKMTRQLPGHFAFNNPQILFSLSNQYPASEIIRQ